MTKKEFKQYLEEKELVFLDGATGSNLQKKGLPFGECAEKWITENSDVLIELQKEYIEAGSNIIYAPTFGANSIKLKEYGLEEETVSLNKKLVEISKNAASDKALVAGDLTMCGQTVEPLGALKLEALIASYEQQVKAVDEAGADLIIIETMMSLQETRAAVIAAKNVSSLPIMVSMTFGENGKTLYGTSVKTAAVVLDALGVDAIGMNCSSGPDKMVPFIKEIKEVSNLPVIAKPNAGLPVLGKDGETVYDMKADAFAGYVKELVNEGAVIIGGCCGTSPEYIRALKNEVKIQHEKVQNKKTDISYITAEREMNSVSDVEFCVIDTSDEDINDEIMEEEFDTIYDLLDEMEDNEQNSVLLKINLDESKAELIKMLIDEITSNTSAPVCFECDNEKMLEAALLYYCGRAGVIFDKDNSNIDLMIKKYGAIRIYK